MDNQSKPWILGVSLSHNGSICLLRGDKIIVAIQEERLTRKKIDFLKGSEPLALNYCLGYAGISKSDLALVVGSSYLLQEETAQYLKVMFPDTSIVTINHHLSHAVGAFATSGFSEAAILVVDGSGSPLEELGVVKESMLPNSCQKEPKSETISLYKGSGTEMIALEKHVGLWLAPGNAGNDGYEMLKFGSLGGIFASAAKQIFGNHADAGKVMGLSPYGQPEIPRSEFFDLIDGRFVFQDTVLKRFPFSEPWPEHQSEYETLAASIQAALEEALQYLVSHLKELCPSDNLVFSGGVALNSVANEKVLFRGDKFKNIYVMSSAEDSGNAIGAAYYGLWQLTKENTQRKLVHDALGRQYSLPEIEAAIAKTPKVKIYESEDAITTTADLLIEGKIVGWFQGRSELGPRALGQRSILCDPRQASAKAYLNSRVKHREGFRPFAPVVLLEEANNWFELDKVEVDSPFMLRVCRFREDKKELVPGVVHVDGTGRVQTVTKERNGKFYDLVCAFFERTGVPVILNTSFNVMGEPIVETPEEALWCMLYTGIDYCLLEERIVTKAQTHNSILDFYPYVKTSNYYLSPKVENKLALGYEYVGDVYARGEIFFSTRNQWGSFEVSGEATWLSLLELIDGNKTGWELLKEFEQKHENIDEFSFMKLLGKLKRFSILDFSLLPIFHQSQ